MFSNLAFRQKILLSLAAVLIVLFAANIYTLTLLYTTSSEAQRVVITHHFEHVRIKHLEWANRLENYLLNDDLQFPNIESDANLCDFGKWLKSAEKKELLENFPQLDELLDQFQEPHFLLHQSSIEIQNLINAGKGKTSFEVRAKYINGTRKNLDKIQFILDEVEREVSKSSITAEELFSNTKRAINVSMLFGFITLLVASVMSFLLSQSIVRPIREILTQLEEVSLGNLTISVNSKRKDELGQVSRHIENVVKKLNEVIGGVKRIAINLSTASVEISSGAQLISNGASHQAGTSEEISTAMEELLSTVNRTSDIAQAASELATQASESLREAGINLSKSGEQFGELIHKVNTISEIAYETNILALNANIEASRAGVSGKGFAVVASNVKTLAEETRQVVKEIERMSTIGDRILTISEFINKHLANQIEESAQTSLSVTSVSAEQVVNVNEVNRAVQELNSIIQRNAASSEELATSAEELSSQASMLSDRVSFFKTLDTTSISFTDTLAQNHPVQQTSETKGKTGVKISLHDATEPNLDNNFESF